MGRWCSLFEMNLYSIAVFGDVVMVVGCGLWSSVEEGIVQGRARKKTRPCQYQRNCLHCMRHKQQLIGQHQAVLYDLRTGKNGIVLMMCLIWNVMTG